MTTSETLQVRVAALGRRVQVLREEIQRVIVGQDELVEQLLVAILAGGHVLLEGLPGLGKTLLVKSLACGLGLTFTRIQFTPDLMPSDVTGTRILDEGSQRQFRFQKGPVFGNLVLADEINRATPKTQSSLLEAMQEGSVTVGGETHPLPRPFHVVATQNPIELEGTFPLPEAQLDRFLFKLVVPTPGVDAVIQILDATTKDTAPQPRSVLSGAELTEFQACARQALCGEHLLRYVAELLRATHAATATDEDTKRLVRFGASPRAGQAIVLAAKVRGMLAGRPSVARHDIDASIVPALRHRIVLSFDAESEGRSVTDMIPVWMQIAAKRSQL